MRHGFLLDLFLGVKIAIFRKNFKFVDICPLFSQLIAKKKNNKLYINKKNFWPFGQQVEKEN